MTDRQELHLNKTFNWSTLITLGVLIVTAILWSGKADSRLDALEQNQQSFHTQLDRLERRTDLVSERLAAIEAELGIVARLQKRVLDVLERSNGHSHPSDRYPTFNNKPDGQ